jgi:hypothetical protein
MDCGAPRRPRSAPVRTDSAGQRAAVNVKEPHAKVFICGGAVLAVAGFFLIRPYTPEVGPLENMIVGSIPIGDLDLPYLYVLIFATIVVGYGFYKLKMSERENLH